ncbi:hypothetical protein KP79_PYT00149 [Mizuhopecten yessoensis]|uniref:Uncharacterized protein n=1 Tax=Mizuhopecten yessoensis TaxID=6573 RepID=A0A210R4Y3_MIZYE|nr:hypothetical protein KP79_PYT00149 [Mizuhopecten yessoensis]
MICFTICISNPLTFHVQKEETQGELDKVQRENEENGKDKSQLETERKSILDKTRSLKGTIDEMSSTTEGLQRGIDRLIGELVKKDEQSLLEESRRFKRKVLVMKLLRTSQSGMGKTMVDMVTKELKRQLGRRPDSRSFDFSIVLHETSTDVSKGPLFVVCLSSKVGKNIPDALEGPKGGRDVYMIVLHHTTKESLSTLTPNSLRATGSELRQLGGIIDMVFSSDIGLCECDFNITAVDKIITVLKKF